MIYSETANVKEIPPPPYSKFFIVLGLISLFCFGVLYFMYWEYQNDIDHQETQAVNYSSILNRINYGSPHEVAALKNAAKHALRDGVITNAEFESFMGAYTAKTPTFPFAEYDQKRYEADKAALLNMLKAEK